MIEKTNITKGLINAGEIWPPAQSFYRPATRPRVARGVFFLGLSGDVGAGKDTVAAHLIARYPNLGIQRFALADPLKVEIYDLLAAADFYSFRSGFLTSDRPQPRWNEARTDAEKIAWVNKFKKELRKMCQIHGTEFRRALDPEYWIDRLLENVAEAGPKIAAVPDIRFLNEIAICHAAIKVEMIGQVEDSAVASHVSEREWRKHDFRDNVVRAAKGDLATLYRESERVFEQILTRFHVQ